MRTIGIEYPAKGEIGFCELGNPPELGATQVLVRTEYSAITNGTERHALLAEHGWREFPSRHGYQHVGRIEAAGKEVKGFAEGDRVFCGQYVGHRAWHVIDVAGADAAAFETHLCIKLPDGLDPRECALFGVAGVALRGVRRFRVAAGDRVWVAGLGLIGQFAAQAARAVGAYVTVSDINERRLALAGECGAHRAVCAAAEDAMAALKAGGPYACIIDACGVPPLLLDIHKENLLAYRGVVGLLAVRGETVFNWHMMHLREASLEVSCHFSLAELRVLIHLLEQKLLRVAPLISHVASVDDAVGIYEALRDRPAELLGVVFDWS